MYISTQVHDDPILTVYVIMCSLILGMFEHEVKIAKWVEVPFTNTLTTISQHWTQIHNARVGIALSLRACSTHIHILYAHKYVRKCTYTRTLILYNIHTYACIIHNNIMYVHTYIRMYSLYFSYWELGVHITNTYLHGYACMYVRTCACHTHQFWTGTHPNQYRTNPYGSMFMYQPQL